MLLLHQILGIAQCGRRNGGLKCVAQLTKCFSICDKFPKPDRHANGCYMLSYGCSLWLSSSFSPLASVMVSLTEYFSRYVEWQSLACKTNLKLSPSSLMKNVLISLSVCQPTLAMQIFQCESLNPTLYHSQPISASWRLQHPAFRQKRLSPIAAINWCVYLLSPSSYVQWINLPTLKLDSRNEYHIAFLAVRYTAECVECKSSKLHVQIYVEHISWT